MNLEKSLAPSNCECRTQPMKVKTQIIVLLLFLSIKAFSQGGGPPMITTDPGTPGNKNWEINTAIGFQILQQTNKLFQTAEFVYGIGNNFQISVQLPMPNREWAKSNSTNFTLPQAGVKYKILDEKKRFFSLSIYPQIIIPIYKHLKPQIFIPLEFEKTFDNFRIGQEIGYFIINNSNVIFSGTIVGYRLQNNLELMGEFFWSKSFNKSLSTTGLLNFGIRKPLKEHLIILSSFGTEIITPDNECKENVFGLIGVQILLGK